MKRRRHPAALAMLLAISSVVIAATGSAPRKADAGGASSPGVDGGALRYASARYGFSAPVPPGWHPSRARLVPKLLAPREVLSLGNFGMRVGGGGNCGREPAASIARMRPGNALVSLQETPVFPKLRAHLRRTYPSRPPHLDLGDLRWLPDTGSGRAGVRGATLDFSANGRAFEALVYVDGAPTPALRADIDAILGGLGFRPGSWDRFHGDEWPAK